MSIEPGSRSTVVEENLDENGDCIRIDGYHLDTPVVLSLTDGQGSPIGGADITVAVDWSGNTFPGNAALALYDDLNGNGVIDGDEELISGVEDDLAIVRTERYAGTRMLLLRTNLSCPFRGNLFAFSGAAAATMPIEVSVEAGEELEGELEEGPEEELGEEPGDDAEDDANADADPQDGTDPEADP